MLWESGPGALHPGSCLGLFISVSPALFQAIEMHWLALVTVTMINKHRGSLDHSWLSLGVAARETCRHVGPTGWSPGAGWRPE